MAIDVSRSLDGGRRQGRRSTARASCAPSGSVSLAAALAGALLLWLVVQSEKLAQQRIRFAASAAHELRTPLAGLRLYGEMLAEGLGDPGRAREYARRMAGEAERLGRVVTNVLSFTRLERGALNVHLAAGDLAEAVRDAYQRQQPALEQAGAPVELELPENLPPVQFDRDAIAHIVQNLLDNAEKYTREREDRLIVLAIEPRRRRRRAASKTWWCGTTATGWRRACAGASSSPSCAATRWTDRKAWASAWCWSRPWSKRRAPPSATKTLPAAALFSASAFTAAAPAAA